MWIARDYNRLDILTRLAQPMPLVVNPSDAAHTSVHSFLEWLSEDEYTKGFSGADLYKLMRESAMIAVRKGLADADGGIKEDTGVTLTTAHVRMALQQCSGSLKGVHVHTPNGAL